MQNSHFWIRITSLYGSQTSPVDLCMRNSANSTRFSNLHGSQTSPVVLCMQNNVTSIKIIGLYRAHPSFVVFACKTANLGPELQVSTGLRPHQWFFAFKTATLQQNCKSLCPSPHLCFLHAKQRLLDQNYKSLWIPDFAFWFVHAKLRD